MKWHKNENNKWKQQKTYFTFLSSTSKTKVEFAGIAGGDPLAPYL